MNDPGWQARQEEFQREMQARNRSLVRDQMRKRGVNRGMLAAVSDAINAIVQWRDACALAQFRNRKR